MYVKAGTAVTLRCLISNCLEEPAYVFWYHGDRRLLDDEDQIPGKFLARKINFYSKQKNNIAQFLDLPAFVLSSSKRTRLGSSKPTGKSGHFTPSLKLPRTLGPPCAVPGMDFQSFMDLPGLEVSGFLLRTF